MPQQPASRSTTVVPGICDSSGLRQLRPVPSTSGGSGRAAARCGGPGVERELRRDALPSELLEEHARLGDGLRPAPGLAAQQRRARPRGRPRGSSARRRRAAARRRHPDTARPCSARPCRAPVPAALSRSAAGRSSGLARARSAMPAAASTSSAARPISGS